MSRLRENLGALAERDFRLLFRVKSYDVLGSSRRRCGSLGVMLKTWALILSLPSVWALRAPGAERAATPTMPAS